MIFVLCKSSSFVRCINKIQINVIHIISSNSYPLGETTPNTKTYFPTRSDRTYDEGESRPKTGNERLAKTADSHRDIRPTGSGATISVEGHAHQVQHAVGIVVALEIDL